MSSSNVPRQSITLDAICPMCGEHHRTTQYFPWIGVGTPRFFCNTCKEALWRSSSITPSETHRQMGRSRLEQNDYFDLFDLIDERARRARREIHHV